MKTLIAGHARFLQGHHVEVQVNLTAWALPLFVVLPAGENYRTFVLRVLCFSLVVHFNPGWESKKPNSYCFTVRV